MNTLLLALQKECMGIQTIAEAINYCYQKILFTQEDTKKYIDYLADFLEKETPSEFLATAKHLRCYSHNQTDWNWQELNESLIAHFDEIDSEAFWSWLICHPNGYVRSVALHKLASLKNTHFLRFLLLTLNDHIEEIRLFSFKKINEVNWLSCKDELLFCFPLIDRLSKLQKTENQLIFDLLTNQLFSHPNLLLQAQKHDDFAISRYAFKLSFSLKDALRVQTIKNGLKKDDRLILFWTFQEIQKEALWEKIYLDKLFRHPRFVIRKLTFEWCYNHRTKERRMLLGLLDPSLAIKRLVINYVKKQFPEIDCRDYYLQIFKKRPLDTIQGLSLIQNKYDRERILSLRYSPQKKIRISVLHWIKCLEIEERSSIYLESLSDSSRDIRKRAIDQLRKDYSFSIKEQLLVLFKESNTYHLQLDILKILSAGNKKEYFFDLSNLYLYAINPTVKRSIEQKLENWLSAWNQRFFFTFSMKEKLELSYLVNKHYQDYSNNLISIMLVVIKT